MRIALCSPGLTRAQAGARTVGLDFLARLIHDKYPHCEFFTLDVKDVCRLSYRDADALLVSCTCIDAAVAYAKAVRFRKPSIFTVLGGPGMLAPAAFRYLADAIIVGRGEDAIFRALDGDLRGMMTLKSTLKNDEVHIFPTSLLSPGLRSTGCVFRCGFCSYGWAHVFATAESALPTDYKGSASTRKHSPQQELMLKDLHFYMLSKSTWGKPVVGLDILTDLDARVVKKPTSFALLRSVSRRIAQEASQASPGVYHARMYTIAAYPWNPPGCDFSKVDEAFSAVSLPDGVRISFDVGLSHFSPHVTTPLECCAESGYDLRNHFAAYDNTWPDKGMFWTLDKLTIPSPRQAVVNTILMRTADPYAIERVARAKNYLDLFSMFPRECGWLDEKPAPWLRRNNDASKRVAEVCKLLGRRMPSGYAPFHSCEPVLGVPTYAP